MAATACTTRLEDFFINDSLAVAQLEYKKVGLELVCSSRYCQYGGVPAQHPRRTPPAVAATATPTPTTASPATTTITPHAAPPRRFADSGDCSPSFSASTAYAPGLAGPYGPSHSLFTDPHGYLAASTTAGDDITATFPRMVEVFEVSLLPRADVPSQMVTRFKLEYADAKANMQLIGSFAGNASGSTAVVRHRFERSVITQRIRLTIEAFAVHPSMRWDLLFTPVPTPLCA